MLVVMQYLPLKGFHFRPGHAEVDARGLSHEDSPFGSCLLENCCLINFVPNCAAASNICREWAYLIELYSELKLRVPGTDFRLVNFLMRTLTGSIRFVLINSAGRIKVFPFHFEYQ